MEGESIREVLFKMCDQSPFCGSDRDLEAKGGAKGQAKDFWSLCKRIIHRGTQVEIQRQARRYYNTWVQAGDDNGLT